MPFLTDTDQTFLARAQRMCGTKAAFTTRPEAVALMRRRSYTGTPYHCPWCGYWHITSYDKAKAKAFKRRLKRLMRDR